MKLAMITPLPPTRSGIAHYASMLLPELAKHAEVQAFESLDGYRREAFDAVVYQLGNNPYHEAAYVEAMREPGVIVLHDLVLHHLVVEMTLARGDAAGYVRALGASHGPEGEAWARGRAAGLHAEIANFLLPASVEVARRSRAVIVHNRYAAERLASFGVTTPIHVVPHPYVPDRRQVDRDALRARLAIRPDDRVIGFFGFLTSAKRGEVVLEAFRIARERNPRLVLLVVGEPAPDIDRASFEREGVVLTGYAEDDEFPAWYAVADRLVNLRYPTAGETSGTLIRALDAGKPVAVSDYAQFAELPDACAVKIPFGEREVESLVSFFIDELADPAPAQRAWLEEHARLDMTAEGYLRALGGEPGERLDSRPAAGIPLFARLELLDAVILGREVSLTVRNGGSRTIETATWGRPELRLIVNLYEEGSLASSRWLRLPSDLAPGGTARVDFDAPGRPDSVGVATALQDIPIVDASEWTRAELRRVR